MTTTAIVWLVVGLLSLTVLVAMLVALVRHVFVLGRAIRRFQEEIEPIAQEVSALADAASDRSRRPGRGHAGS